MNELRKEQKMVEEYIKQHLEHKKQPGLKMNGTEYRKEQTVQYGYKSKDQKVMDGIGVLRDHGIKNAEDVLEEVMKSMKGEKREKVKLKIVKEKKK